jgi:hypothetical protein
LWLHVLHLVSGVLFHPCFAPFMIEFPMFQVLEMDANVNGSPKNRWLHFFYLSRSEKGMLKTNFKENSVYFNPT